jgi:hypothetical protein
MRGRGHECCPYNIYEVPTGTSLMVLLKREKTANYRNLPFDFFHGKTDQLQQRHLKFLNLITDLNLNESLHSSLY